MSDMAEMIKRSAVSYDSVAEDDPLHGISVPVRSGSVVGFRLGFSPKMI